MEKKFYNNSITKNRIRRKEKKKRRRRRNKRASEMIGDRCVHVFPRQAREVIIGRFVDPWKDRKCAHGYRLAMRGSIRSATPTSTRRSDLETRGGGRRKKTKRKERSHDQALGCTGHVRLMAKRRYTMAYVSNHIKQ